MRTLVCESEIQVDHPTLRMLYKIVCHRTLMTHNNGTKRVQVSFTEEQWKLIEEVKGNMGKSNADAVRNIVISWLAEKSFISTTVKGEMNSE